MYDIRLPVDTGRNAARPVSRSVFDAWTLSLSQGFNFSSLCCRSDAPPFPYISHTILLSTFAFVAVLSHLEDAGLRPLGCSIFSLAEAYFSFRADWALIRCNPHPKCIMYNIVLL